MSIREVIQMLEYIVKMLMEFFSGISGESTEETEETTTEAV